MTLSTEREAYHILDQLQISFCRIDHKPMPTVKHYDAQLPGPQVKNLLLKDKQKQFYFVIILEDKMLDLKQLSKKLKTSRLSFATSEELNLLLGLQPGTVTPIALHHDYKQKIRVVIDKEIDQDSTIGIHPNVNTTTLIINYQDLERYFVWSFHQPIYLFL